jgi:hypothetical protein
MTTALLAIPQWGKRTMRKLMIAVIISAAFIISGISATTFSAGQLTSTAAADAGGE